MKKNYYIKRNQGGIRRYKYLIAAFFGLAIGITEYGPAIAQTWGPVGSPGFLADSVDFTSIAIDRSGTPYVAYSLWNDTSTSLGQATVMKYNGSSWVNVGSPSFTAGSASFTTIALDTGGMPYIAYSDYANSMKASVMKFNGTGWINLGVAGFSDTRADYTSIAIGLNDTPYIAYADGYPGPATVKKFNGSSWVTVGTEGFSPSSAWFTNIAIDRSGTPYVAFQDGSLFGAAMVMKYDGSNWVTAGSADFSAGGAFGTALALDSAGTPYVAYRDDAYGVHATVMKFNGADWVNVGRPGFSADQVLFPSIAIDMAGTPYIAYQDITGCAYCGSGPATVMKYMDTGWVTVGNAGFSAGTAGINTTSLVIGPNGAPYVAYQDSANGYRATVMTLVPSCPITGDTVVCLGDVATTLSDTCNGGVWSSGNTSIATVGTASGVVKGIAVGTAIISYTVLGSVATQMVLVSACINGVKNTASPNGVSMVVTPNPNHGLFTISLSSSTNEAAQITITNTLGEKVKECTILTNKKTEMQLQVEPGIYFISAVVDDECITEKIVVE